MGGGGSYLGGGPTGYSPVPQRYDAPEPSSRATTQTPSSNSRAPAFKGSGMKLGSKKTKQAELLDALGGDVLASSSLLADAPAPSTPSAVSQPTIQQSHSQQGAGGRGSIPEVEEER